MGNVGWSSGCTTTINWNATSTSQPYYIVPAQVGVATPEPVDDSALAWLRSQVAEIAELARAA